MALPGVNNTTTDGALGASDSDSSSTVVVFGVATQSPTLISSVTSSGTTPPAVTLSGVPLEVADLKIDIQTGGARATATFRWSKDDGLNWVEADVVTAASVVLGDTGVTAAFATGTYNGDNVYTATIQPIPVFTFSNKDAAVDECVSGSGVELVAEVHENAPGTTVLFVPVPASVAGSNSDVASAGTTPPAVTLSGTPLDDYEGRVDIVEGGARGTATFKYSLDGGDNWSAEIVTAATYEISGTGITLNFASGTYEADNAYEWTSTGPSYTTTDLSNAFAAKKRDGRPYKLALIDGVASGASDAAKATACATFATTLSSLLSSAASEHQPAEVIISAPNVSDTAIKSAFASFNDRRVIVAAGFVEHTSAITRRSHKRPAVFGVAAVAAKRPISENWGNPVEANRLPRSITKLYRDEQKVSGGLNDFRFLTFRTWPGGVSGFFVTEPKTMAASGSDFASAPECLVMDEVDRVTYRELTQHVLRKIRVNSATGRILEAEAVALEKRLEAVVRSFLGDNIVDVKIVINRTDNLLSTRKLRYKTRVTPFAYPKTIENEMGYTNPALFVAAAA